MFQEESFGPYDEPLAARQAVVVEHCAAFRVCQGDEPAAQVWEIVPESCVPCAHEVKNGRFCLAA
jgi:hypothetical protein